jgi:hypothetical protein
MKNRKKSSLQSTKMEFSTYKTERGIRIRTKNVHFEKQRVQSVSILSRIEIDERLEQHSKADSEIY